MAGIPVQVRLPPHIVSGIDAYIAANAGAKASRLTRPQVIRSIILEWLLTNGRIRQS